MGEFTKDSDFKNIWELYGFRGNPFDTSPLLVMGGNIPIGSFVGRKKEVNRLNKLIGSTTNSRTLIYGDIGVGKTTFVNVVRRNAYDKGYFTPIKEIAVLETWTPEMFLLNTLAAIYGTLKLMTGEKPVSPDVFKKLESLLEIGRKNMNLGIEVAGIGGSYGKNEIPPLKLTISTIQDFFEEIITEIIKSTGKEVIIHYNNLELLKEKSLKFIFDNLRDFFQTNGVHFIFVGNLTVHSSLQNIPRFSSILTDTPFFINNLTFEEVQKILQKRFKSLAIPKLNYIIPYTNDALKSLYDLMDGNIRHILNSLSIAVIESTTERPIVLSEYDLAETLNKVLHERYLKGLTDRKIDVLREILEHKEITNKGISDNLGISRSNVSTYISDLKDMGCVYLKRKQGKDKFWSVTPRIKWFLLRPPPKEEGQKTVEYFFK